MVQDWVNLNMSQATTRTYLDLFMLPGSIAAETAMTLTYSLNQLPRPVGEVSNKPCILHAFELTFSNHLVPRKNATISPTG